MEVFRATADTLVLRTTRQERLRVLLLLLMGLLFAAYGCGWYLALADRVAANRPSGMPWLIPLASGLVLSLVGLYLTGEERRLVFRRASAACECTWTWFACFRRTTTLAPVTILCTQRRSRQGALIYRVTVYANADVGRGMLGRVVATLRGRSFPIGSFKDPEAVDAILDQVAVMTERQVLTHTLWHSTRSRQRAKSTRNRRRK